jgi:hypothetical protein
MISIEIKIFIALSCKKMADKKRIFVMIGGKEK